MRANPSADAGLPCEGEPDDIFRASAEGDLNGIRRYLAEGYSINVSSLCPGATHGKTPLHLAAAAGASEAVRLLLQEGAEPNARSGDTGETALHEAARIGALSCARLLLAAGADAGIRCRAGFSASDTACDSEWFPESELYWLLHEHSGGKGWYMSSPYL